MNAYQKFNQLAEQVTNEIIAALEQGQFLWQKPWSAYGLPRNYYSHRPYEGFNAFYLNYITGQRGFSAPYFLTFRQTRELGCRVRKGEKGTPVIYWKVYEKASGNPTSERLETKDQERSERRYIPFLWTVFNIDQVEGVNFRLPEMMERTGQ